MRVSGAVNKPRIYFGDSTPGNVLVDMSSYRADGTFVNSPEWKRDGSGLWCIDFKGTDVDVNRTVDCGTAVDLSGLSALTMVAWIYPTNLPTGGTTVREICGQGVDHWLAITSAGLIASYVMIGASAKSVANSTPVTLNKWQLACLTWNGANIYAWIDAASSSAGTAAGKLDTVATKFGWGNNASVLNRGFPGYIIPEGIYKYTMTQAQITGIYNRFARTLGLVEK